MTSSLFDLSGQVALITGTSRGLGQYFARALANAGASAAAAPDGTPGGTAPAPDGASGGFELVATYGDFDETTALDAPTAWRMILVLRRA